MSGTVMLSTDSMKEVGNMRIAPIQRVRALIMSISWGMIMVGWLSMADLLNLVVLRGVPVQRNDNFTVEVDHVIVNADTLTHQSVYTFCHLPPFILLL